MLLTAAAAEQPGSDGPTFSTATQPGSPLSEINFASLAVWLYLVVAGALLMRLLYGVGFAFRLWRAAQPVTTGTALRLGAGIDLRFSQRVSSPVTIGSGVVLPADYTDWGDEKLRIVVAHERSHIEQGDFYLQMLAAFYAAVVWFSPLGWWLKRRLYDLGETISDHSGLEEAADRCSYAQILLEFAAAPRTTVMGVAMARQSRISRRIESLLNENALRQAFTVSRRTLATALLVPAVLFAATAFVHVTATAQAPQQAAPTQSQTPATGPSSSEPAQPADDATPAETAAPEATLASPQAEPTPLPSPAAAPAPAPPVHVEVPAVHVNVPAIHINVPAQHIEVPAIHVEVPAQKVDVPAQHIDVPAQHVDVPAVHVNVPGQHIDVPAIHVNVPAQHIDVPAIHIDVPPSGTPGSSDGRAANGPGGELLAMLNGFGHALFQRASLAAIENGSGEPQATFDRNLSFNGKLDLSVGTGSGNITLTQGPANQLRIHGIVRGNQKADPAQVEQIAANPPIEQEGNTIRIGGHNEKLENISIDYEIEAPVESAVNAASGSGNITDNGVGQEAKLITGSGNIQAKGIQGGFKAQTGSGNIEIDGTGQGESKAQTGSGNIDLKGVQGALMAQTGSGSIKAEGKPTSAWKLQAGSGDIELATGSAPVNLDASTGSGEIKTNRSEGMESSSDHHHVRAQLNGGGPELKAETGSGDIRID